MAGTWNHVRALEHIDIRMDDVRDVTVKDYARDMSLESIPTKVASESIVLNSSAGNDGADSCSRASAPPAPPQAINPAKTPA